jgi:photosystem II stability/assembly factor-like uncharacterized protein
MRQARAFFFVCAGLLCLAVAYHFGAQNAGAQATDYPAVSVACTGSRVYAVTSNGDFYTSDDLGSSWTAKTNPLGSGGAVPYAVADLACTGSLVFVIASNGGVYRSDDYGTSWTAATNVPGGAVSAQTMTMGQLKVKYATPATGK